MAGAFTLQDGAAALVVAACFAYAAWTLAPAGLRRRAARALLAVRGWPAPLAAYLRRVALPPAGCGGCGSCGGEPAATSRSAPPGPAVRPIVFHRRGGGG